MAGHMVRACVWLAVLSSCDGMKSEQSTREYQHALVVELCAPGAYYRECWWTDAENCHQEVAIWLAVSMPHNKNRVQPSEALRRYMLDRLFYYHAVFQAQFMWDIEGMESDKEACWDGTPWKHRPPGKEGSMADVREHMAERRRSRREAPTPPTPPEPSFETAPEPSPGPAPEPAPGP